MLFDLILFTLLGVLVFPFEKNFGALKMYQLRGFIIELIQLPFTARAGLFVTAPLVSCCLAKRAGSLCLSTRSTCGSSLIISLLVVGYFKHRWFVRHYHKRACCVCMHGCDFC